MRTRYALNWSNEVLQSVRSKSCLGVHLSISAIPMAIAGPCSNSPVAPSFHAADKSAASPPLCYNFLIFGLRSQTSLLGSLLDIASQLLERRPRASLIVLGSNARRNVLEQDSYGCSALFSLKGDLHDHLAFEGRIDRIKGDRFDDSSRWRQFHKPCRISIFPFSRLATDSLFG